ncbi:CAP domain-containing protein [Fulvivirga sp. 29W222]|uniref:CAP domain-containing protein n=1 Tax=Fulvivirga marina TaxID=2494733 RepID=A0A937KC22_9BACT|nr:CAP domain-containing protein [Fulvivirga marina]MBL6446884.1 CAP domain-containing protein [Fulvivirga marina]
MMHILLFFMLSLFPESLKESATADICVSSEEQKLYNIINEYRAKKKLKPIPFSAKLTKVAQIHAKDLSDYYNFDPSNECNPHSWSKNGMWSSCCYTNDHKMAKCMWDKPKEIAAYDSPGYEIAYYSSVGANAEEGLQGWQKSPGHNPLLINSGMWKQAEWNAIGIGIYKEYAVVWFGQLKDDQSQIIICNDR